MKASSLLKPFSYGCLGIAVASSLASMSGVSKYLYLLGPESCAEIVRERDSFGLEELFTKELPRCFSDSGEAFSEKEVEALKVIGSALSTIDEESFVGEVARGEAVEWAESSILRSNKGILLLRIILSTEVRIMLYAVGFLGIYLCAGNREI